MIFRWFCCSYILALNIIHSYVVFFVCVCVCVCVASSSFIFFFFSVVSVFGKTELNKKSAIQCTGEIDCAKTGVLICFLLLRTLNYVRFLVGIQHKTK